jgi:hypothetical protein
MPVPEIVCVLGMHRSGTSLLTRILNLLGVYLGPIDHLLAAAPDNPTGFWEHRQLLEVNEAILGRFGGGADDPPDFPAGWAAAPALEDLRQQARAVVRQDFGTAAPWGWKDPRTCLTLPFWTHLLPPMRFVVCLRDPYEVVQSLGRRNGYSAVKSVYLWLVYADAILRHTAERPRRFVFYEDLLEDPAKTTRCLARFLDLGEADERPPVQQAIADFIDQGLRHHRAFQTAPAGDSVQPVDRGLALAREAFLGLRRPDGAAASKALQDVERALEVIIPEFREEKRQAEELQRRWVQETEQDLAALARRGGTILLVDAEAIRGDLSAVGPLLPFLERDGQYWGSPEDDDDAVRELERLQRAGAHFLAFAWPAFWWLDYYAAFHRYLCSTFPCTVRNERLIVFELTPAPVRVRG